MPTLAERLGAILEPRYRLGSQVGEGGMAVVFRAEDTSLARPVAVKVLRPELATAVGAGRFLREARALASVSHPNVVAVHECGERDGLHYYVMDFEESPTLRACLDRGARAEMDAWRVGIDLLAALDAAHARGVIHRDVKPANIFLRPDRAVLADFGVARDVRADAEPLTGTESPGTPAYMAPEQAAGGLATVRSDLYSAGMVVYEAFTGRRWPSFLPPARADWTGVPRRARAALVRALDPDPARRWPDAASFRDALRRARRRRPTGLRVAVVAFGALAMLLLWVARPKPPPPIVADLAVLPCRAAPVDSAAAHFAWWYATTQLESLRGIHVLRGEQTLNAWERRRARLPPGDWVGWSEALGARWVGSCRLGPEADAWVLSAELHDGHRSEGSARRQVPRGDSLEAGRTLFRAFVEAMAAAELTGVSPDEAGVLADRSPHAIVSFLNGKDLFRRDALRAAADSFARALEEDGDFALAEWRLAETQRWLAHSGVDVDLERLHERGSARLPVPDSLLLAARIAPYEEKLALLRDIVRAYPSEAYVMLVLADESYHRGGLWGVPVDSAVPLFEAAVRKDPALAPAVEHLTQALIRLGRKEEAERSLALLREVTGPEDEHDVFYPGVWEQAFRERFDDEASARESFERMARNLDGRGMLSLLRLGCRWVRYVELPATQARLGRRLVGLAREWRSPEDEATGLLAIALGNLGMGRLRPAFAALDSVAAVVRSPEARLQAAEWRVLPYALELAGYRRVESEAGARALAGIWSDRSVEPPLRARAALALALLAERIPLEGRGTSWADSLRSLGPGVPIMPGGDPSTLLAGVERVRAGDPGGALEATDGLVAYDSVALRTYPFGRSLAYWLRASWQAAKGDTAQALRTLYWHENTDLKEHTPPGIAQAAEVDAALGVHARARSVQLAGNHEGTSHATGLPRCSLVLTRAADVVRLWESPDPGIDSLLAEVKAIRARNARECPR
jgi:tetratricopeptide (TPR) repeat protein